MSNFHENQISKIQKECSKYSTLTNSTRENDSVKECLDIVKNCLKYKTVDKIPGALERLKIEFDKNFDSRIYAVQNGAYDLILNVMISYDEENQILRLALKTMIRLAICQSNLLNEEGINYQMDLLKREKNLSNVQLLLRWMKQCCIKSEKNRQDIFNANVIDVLKNILESKFVHGSKLQDICSLLRALTLDDDLEFDYGNSVERAREIGNDTLIPITILLDKFKQKEKVLCEILQTLITLLAKNEYSKKVDEAGGLNSILDIMRSFPDDENINRLILRLFKVLSANHDVKIHLIAQGAAPLIISAISRIKTGAMAVAGLTSMAGLTLGSFRNSRIFYDCEAPRLIIETMKRYPGSINVQSYGTRTISNMAMESKIDSTKFLDYDVEPVLEMAMKIHGDEIEKDIKTAFYNLGLDSELKDHWTKTP